MEITPKSSKDDIITASLELIDSQTEQVAACEAQLLELQQCQTLLIYISGAILLLTLM